MKHITAVIFHWFIFHFLIHLFNIGKHIVVFKPIVAADFTIINKGTLTNQTILDVAAIVLTKEEAKSMLNVSTTRNSEIVDLNEKVVEKHTPA